MMGRSSRAVRRMGFGFWRPRRASSTISPICRIWHVRCTPSIQGDGWPIYSNYNDTANILHLLSCYLPGKIEDMTSAQLSVSPKRSIYIIHFLMKGGTRQMESPPSWSAQHRENEGPGLSTVLAGLWTTHRRTRNDKKGIDMKRQVAGAALRWRGKKKKEFWWACCTIIHSYESSNGERVRSRWLGAYEKPKHQTRWLERTLRIASMVDIPPNVVSPNESKLMLILPSCLSRNCLPFPRFISSPSLHAYSYNSGDDCKLETYKWMLTMNQWLW